MMFHHGSRGGIRGWNFPSGCHPRLLYSPMREIMVLVVLIVGTYTLQDFVYVQALILVSSFRMMTTVVVIDIDAQYYIYI